MNPKTILVAIALGAWIAVLPRAQEPKPKQDPAPAAGKQDPKDELKDRMAARYPLVSSLRDAGKIGETPTGDVKLVKAEYGAEKADAKDAGKGTVAEVIAAENKDRQASYELLAKELGAKGEKITAADVARQKGALNIKRASPDHWIEVDNSWVQRKTVKTETREKPPSK